MSGGWFITGTDTGVGKTRIACLLLEALARAGRRAVGMKPVASGCRETAAVCATRMPNGCWLERPGDYAGKSLCVCPALAPHPPRMKAGWKSGEKNFRFSAPATKVPWLVVEGVGGWMVPLGEHRRWRMRAPCACR